MKVALVTYIENAVKLENIDHSNKSHVIDLCFQVALQNFILYKIQKLAVSSVQDYLSLV